ncbi:MAG: hypothetical protein P8179_21955 [Candidatus Thiodiazotropha sp.]
MKDNAVAEGNLPKYLLASIGQSASNVGHIVPEFAANLVGNKEKADLQWSDFKEYSLEASEGTNAIEVEFSGSYNYHGMQAGVNIAFGVDNQGRIDFAYGMNAEPNTDVKASEPVDGFNIAKARQVESVTDLLSGYSVALEGSIGSKGVDLSYGEGVLLTSHGNVAFNQFGASVSAGNIAKSPWLSAGLSADYESSFSLSQHFTVNKMGFEMGWAGKALYGLLNLTWGNSLDELKIIR